MQYTQTAMIAKEAYLNAIYEVYCFYFFCLASSTGIASLIMKIQQQLVKWQDFNNQILQFGIVLDKLSQIIIILCLYTYYFIEFMPKRDYYQILGLTKNATDSDIKKAYKQLAVIWHPDKNPDNRDEAVEKFREISQAYENLSDPEKRKIYDSSGAQGHKSDLLSHFNFAQADKMFTNFFQKNPFDNDDDDFFSSFFNRRKSQTSSASANGGGLGSGFKDGFLLGSMFDNEDQFNNYQGSSRVGKSVNYFTKIVNGKTVITKKTTITKEDGTKEVNEEVVDNSEKTRNKLRNDENESSRAKDRLKN